MKTKKLYSILALLLVLCAIAMPACAPKNDSDIKLTPGIEEVLKQDAELLASYEQFYRIDLDSTTAYKDELEAVRIITAGMYELGEAKEKYGLDPNYEIDLKGLDTLNVSASAQFSEAQFCELADTLREVAGDKKIVIVDLREESHYLVNGISLSRFSLHNWANLGLSLDEITEKEQADFTSLLGKTIKAYSRDGDERLDDDYIELTVESVMSERELVESEGFTYLRIPCTDHVWPTSEEIDAFIDYVKSVDVENTWFHFHCAAGKGRTGTFVMLYDKMKNPDVSMKDILYRQSKMSSNYPLFRGESDDGYKIPLYNEKADMTPLLFEYVEKNYQNDYETSFTEWLAKREEK